MLPPSPAHHFRVFLVDLWCSHRDTSSDLVHTQAHTPSNSGQELAPFLLIITPTFFLPNDAGVFA